MKLEFESSSNLIEWSLAFHVKLVLKAMKCSKGHKLELKYQNNTEKPQFSYRCFPKYFHETLNIE